MDELAFASNKDPLEYRLAYLKNERLRGVLEAAAKRFGWEERRKAKKPNRGIGLACGTEKGSYVAGCVEVEVTGKKAPSACCEVCQAFECGAIQNPDNLRAQMEGCIIMTLGGALKEEIQFEGGRLLNGKFSKYPVPRFKDVPAIEVGVFEQAGSSIDRGGGNSDDRRTASAGERCAQRLHHTCAYDADPGAALQRA